jgi:chloride channel protein, CIC family
MRKTFGFIQRMARTCTAKLRGSPYVLMILVASLIGVGGGLGAVGFRYLIRIVQLVAFGSWQYSLELVKSIPWYVLAFIPAAGLVVIFPLVNWFAKETKGHGVPEVMEAVALRGGAIRPRIVFVKALASAICIGTGGSVGREGPIVQIGSAFGSALGQLLRIPPNRLRTLVGCGAAAGIAGTFNAPIAGALFSVEVILGDFGLPHFSPIVVSSVVSTVVARHFLGDTPAFIMPLYRMVSAYELAPYALLGLVAGLVGVGFSTLLYKTEDLFERLKLPEIVKPIMGGLFIGLIALRFPHILGVGYETIDLALAGKMAGELLMALVLLKLVATCTTLAAGGSGGIFAPSLFLGAMTGGFVGTVVHLLLPSVTAGSGAYATVGMGAVVAAATHAPLTAIIIIFEMTGDYKIIPPLMISCVIATVLSLRLDRSSIYTKKLERRGIDLFKPLEMNVLKKFPVSEVLDRKPLKIPETTPFGQLLDLVVSSSRSEFFVVRNGDHYVGTISIHQMREVLLDGDWLNPLIIAKDMADPTYPALKPSDSLDAAMKLFGRQHVEELPVVEDSKLIGSVKRTDVIEEYHRELMKRDLAGSFQGALAWTARTKSIDLGEDYMMAEMECPPDFVGKSLRELNARVHYGVEVILIRPAKQPGREAVTVVSPDYRFTGGDVLLVVGKKANVRNLME